MNQSPATNTSGLMKGLGGPMAVAVVVGTVIGSGIFKKPQSIAGELPGFGWIAVVWVLGGLLALLGALALAEVAVLFPKAGGNYVFLREGYGRLAGFLWGWVDFWIIRAASLAALATIFTESLHDILKETLAPSPGDVLSFWDQRFLTVAAIAALALVNIRGVRWGGGLQLIITTVKIASLLAIALLPLVFWGEWERGEDSLPLKTQTFTLKGFGTALLGVLWSYHGWMNLAPVAEEVKNPQKNIPRAFLMGVGIVIFLYLSANGAYHLVIPQGRMAALNNTTVAAETCFDLLGPLGRILASGAVMCSVFGALNGNLLVGPRLLFAMGEDRLAPQVLGAIHRRYRTPALAIAVTAGWAILLVILVGLIKQGAEEGSILREKQIFDILTDYAMFGAVIFETLAVTTIFVFRRTLPDVPRSYRCWGYPVVPLLYLVLPALILGNMFFEQQIEVLTGTIFVTMGALVYGLFLRTWAGSPGDPQELS